MAFGNTTRPTIDPVATDNNGHGVRYNHPAFGQVGAHRISGSRVLYGSDFQHNGFVRIKISTSQLVRDLAHDWHHAKDTIVEVDVSEAQWASFVSGMNVGDGVPCTLNFTQGQGMMPDLPLPSRPDQFQAEVDERLKIVTDEIAGALALIDSLGLPKGKAEQIKQKLHIAHMNARSNVPFVAKSFGEHMERTVEKAKVEIHGYMNNALRSAGLEHLQAQAPIALEDHGEDAEDNVLYSFEAGAKVTFTKD